MEYDNDEIEEENEIEDNNKKNKKCGLFSFSSISKYAFLPFILPIFCMIADVLYFFIYNNDNTNNYEKEINTNYFLVDVLDPLSTILGGLFLFIPSLREKMKVKKNVPINGKKSSSSSSIELIYNENIPNRNISKIFLYLFLISLFNYISIFIANIIEDYEVNIFETRIYNCIFLPIFSKLILKENIYKHQILSLSLFYRIFYDYY